MLTALLRFGPLGTALLLALPLVLAARYAFGRALLRLTASTRPPTDDERPSLTDALDDAGLAAGKDAVHLPELYTGYLVAASLAFATLVGVDPDGFGSSALAIGVADGSVSAAAAPPPGDSSLLAPDEQSASTTPHAVPATVRNERRE